MQELTLNVSHFSKVKQQTEVLRQVFALRPCALLQLCSSQWHKTLHHKLS